MDYIERLREISNTAGELAATMASEDALLRDLYVQGRRGETPTQHQKATHGNLKSEIKLLKGQLRELLKDFFI